MKKMNIKIAVALMFGTLLAAGCGKDNPEDTSIQDNNQNDNGGIAWPERRVTHIESPVNELTYDFTWLDGKVVDILSVSSDLWDTIRYSFTYTGDKISKTHYEYRRKNHNPLVCDFIYEYSGNEFTKAKIVPEGSTVDEHTSYYTFSYNGSKLAKAMFTGWSHNTYTTDNGTTETWEEEQPFTFTLSWSGDNISSIGYLVYGQFTELTTIEYDNHSNPLYMPLGPIEALSLPLLEDYMFGINYFDDGKIMSNMLWNANNITGIPLLNVRYRYEYDASGLFPTTIYLVKPDGTEQVFMNFTYEN